MSNLKGNTKKKERKERVTCVIDREYMKILREYDINRSELFNDAARKKAEQLEKLHQKK